MTKLVEEAWNSYAAQVLPKSAPQIQIQECRRAFYGGAWAFLTGVMGMLSPDDEPTANDLAAMEEAWNELVEFRNDVQAGRK